MRSSRRPRYRRRRHGDRTPGAGESVADRIRMRSATATRSRRVLPDFLVLGGQRCGSTTLYTMLTGHPQVLPASHKEPHFFDNNRPRRGFYRRLFPLGAHMRHARPAGRPRGHRRGDDLLPGAPGRARAGGGDAARRAADRDPARPRRPRPLHYQLSVRGRPRAALVRGGAGGRAGADRRRGAAAARRAGLTAHPTATTPTASAASTLDQLERWWSAVPRDRLLVLRSEDMFADPGAVYRRAATFLGLDPDDRRAFEARNRVTY